MKIAHLVIATLLLFLALFANADDACHYMKERNALSDYDTGGPYKLEHFKMTKDRRDLRSFLWSHWHGHTKGIAEAHAKGSWGIDVEIHRPVQPPPCSVFHADSLVRIPIGKPDEDYPAQTLGPYFPDRRIPAKSRLEDSDARDAKYFWIVLVANEETIGGSI